jgi:protein required for attachment to host cells
VKREECTWVLVANRAGAKLFERRTSEDGVALVRTIDHPDGRLERSAFNADRSGRAFQRHGGGSSSLEKAHDPVEQEADRFAHRLADIVRDGGTHEAFQRLVLVAGPRLLGRLKKALRKPASDRLTRTVPKDIASFADHVLRVEVARILDAR